MSETGLCCDVCQAEKDIQRPAKFDAPLGGGFWANLCEFCFYRLPAAAKELSTPTEGATL